MPVGRFLFSPLWPCWSMLTASSLVADDVLSVARASTGRRKARRKRVDRRAANGRWRSLLPMEAFRRATSDEVPPFDIPFSSRFRDLPLSVVFFSFSFLCWIPFSSSRLFFPCLFLLSFSYYSLHQLSPHLHFSFTTPSRLSPSIIIHPSLSFPYATFLLFIPNLHHSSDCSQIHVESRFMSRQTQTKRAVGKRATREDQTGRAGAARLCSSPPNTNTLPPLAPLSIHHPMSRPSSVSFSIPPSLLDPAFLTPSRPYSAVPRSLPFTRNKKNTSFSVGSSRPRRASLGGLRRLQIAGRSWRMVEPVRRFVYRAHCASLWRERARMYGRVLESSTSFFSSHRIRPRQLVFDLPHHQRRRFAPFSPRCLAPP